MFKEVESHFAQLPSIDIGRSTIDIPHTHKFTGCVGDINVLDWFEVLPGDTHKVKISEVVRLTTLASPLMDNMYMDIHAYDVPLRLVWDHAKEFFGENTQSAWIPPTEYRIPMINVGTGVDVGSIADQMGVPPGVPLGLINALPIRALALIYNEWYRDENLTDPINLYTGDATVDYDATKPETGGIHFKAAKFHDAYTSALPAPQKGPSVALSFLGENVNVPVFSSATNHDNIDYNAAVWDPLTGSNPLRLQFGSDISRGYQLNTLNSAPVPSGTGEAEVSLRNYGTLGLEPTNLWAHLEDAQLMTINQLRQAFQIQKFYEASARSGSRYTETILGHFGVSSPDARLQRPQYLGGKRIPITIHQVTNQTESEQAFLGELGAFSVTADSDDIFEFSSTEHSIIMILCTVRYDHSYPQGIDEYWRRSKMFDFYWPEFANLGEMPVRNDALYAQDASILEHGNSDTFGYQEAWYQYRFRPNRNSGYMRPGVNNGLFTWSLADNYSELPTLSDGWIKEDPANVDRVLVTTAQAAGFHFWVDALVEDRATRPLPVYSIPGLIDHH